MNAPPLPGGESWLRPWLVFRCSAMQKDTANRSVLHKTKFPTPPESFSFSRHRAPAQTPLRVRLEASASISARSSRRVARHPTVNPPESSTFSRNRVAPTGLGARRGAARRAPPHCGVPQIVHFQTGEGETCPPGSGCAGTSLVARKLRTPESNRPQLKKAELAAPRRCDVSPPSHPPSALRLRTPG